MCLIFNNFLFLFIQNICIASKKLPCNHIFHKSCLRSWFQRHQTCPTCRLDILRQNIILQPPAPAVRPQLHSRTPQAADSATNTSTVSDSQQLPDNSGPSVPGTSNTQNDLQHTFKPFQQQQAPHMDETNINSSNSVSNESGLSQQNELNESWTSFMNAIRSNNQSEPIFSNE